MDYMHARSASPILGRFLRVDPVPHDLPASPQGWNRYSYVGNNPVAYIDPDGKTIRLASDFNQRQVKKALIRTAMRPSGRQDLERMASDKNFTVNFKKSTLTDIAAARRQVAETGSARVTFGQTIPVQNAETHTYTQAIVLVDTTAIGTFHSDKTGVTTTAHEFHHVEAFRQGKTYEQVLEGDFPSSGSGPAEQYGQSIAAEETDISYRQAKRFVEDLLAPAGGQR